MFQEKNQTGIRNQQLFSSSSLSLFSISPSPCFLTLLYVCFLFSIFSFLIPPLLHHNQSLTLHLSIYSMVGLYFLFTVHNRHTISPSTSPHPLISMAFLFFGVSNFLSFYFQLREEFDSGRDVILTSEHNPHDVAALLKEFFRDLPDPLLTRELYAAFVATRRT